MKPSGMMIDYVINHYKNRPDEPAFYDQEQVITYADFYYLCGHTITLLEQAGIKAGDRVAFWSLNTVEWLAMYMASSAMGAVCVPINTRSSLNEIAQILAATNVKALFAQPRIGKIHLEEILAVSIQLECVFVAQADGSIEKSARVILFERNITACIWSYEKKYQNALTILFATSGTTNDSKLVAHTQCTIATHCYFIAHCYGMDAEEVVLLAALPFNGVFGFNAVLAGFFGAKAVVILDQFDANEAVRVVRQYNVTHAFGSDEMFRRMTAVIEQPLRSPRVFGFAAFSPDVPTLAEQALQKGMPLFGLYGSSEVQALFAVQPENVPIPQRWLGGGKVANPQTLLRVVDFDKRLPLELGQIGELEIKSTSNFIGYLDNPSATKQVITSDGYFKTGDFGYLTAEDAFIYLGRRGDAIRLGGYLVDPKEIENKIKALPSIADVAVVGVTQGTHLSCVAFYVESQPVAHHEELIKEHLMRHVSAYKMPTHFYRLDALPVTQSANGGKVKRAQLRELALQYGAQYA